MHSCMNKIVVKSMPNCYVNYMVKLISLVGGVTCVIVASYDSLFGVYRSYLAG